MWLLVFLFLFTTFALAWVLFGYFIVIWMMGLFRGKKRPVLPGSWPVLSIVIPCFNEESDIIKKLENVRKLDYPKDKLEVVFVDGGSTDSTLSLLDENIRDDEPYRVHRCQDSGKINQLNEALPGLTGEIVVSTDADTIMDSDSLQWFVAEFSVSPEIEIVGAFVSPESSMNVEHYYWDSQNKARLMESDAYSSSIVIAPCFAFRKGFIDSFPEDVVADDVYISSLAHTRGSRVVYSRYVKAVETRTPGNYNEFLPHKFRKSNAVLRESLRFLYLLPDMNFFCKMMTITRMAQQLLLPWGMLWWFLLAGSLMTIFPVVRYDIVLFCTLLLLILFLTTARIFASVRLPEGVKPFKHTSAVALEGYSVTMFILLVTGLSYLFYKQNSNYNRLRIKGD